MLMKGVTLQSGQVCWPHSLWPGTSQPEVSTCKAPSTCRLLSSTLTSSRSTALLHLPTSPPSMSATWAAVRTGGGHPECDAQQVEGKCGCVSAALARLLVGKLHTSTAVALLQNLEFFSRHCGEKLWGLIDWLPSLSLLLLVLVRPLLTRSLGLTWAILRWGSIPSLGWPLLAKWEEEEGPVLLERDTSNKSAMRLVCLRRNHQISSCWLWETSHKINF